MSQTHDVTLERKLSLGLYNAALWLLTPIYLARLWWRGRREPHYRRRVRERLGHYRRRLSHRPDPEHPFIWVHAVSLGETRAAKPLIEALQLRFPAARLLLTCSTATGVEAGRALMRERDVQTWLPYDSPSATRRFFARFRPLVGVLMETEIWPNLIFDARRANVPVVLANARLSQRSLERGRRFDLILRPAVQSLTRVLAQSIPDAQRLRDAGAQPVEVCGNLKFDITPPPKMLALGLSWRTPLTREVVLMAVSREGEEAMLLQAWQSLARPRPLLLIVPRHPQRFSDVASMVRDSGMTIARRSAWGDHPTVDDGEVDVWLGDSMGEMPVYYAASDVCLLGGSFAALGGQNLIEAAACGCPIVMGPHTFNFEEASELALQSRAAIRVSNLHDGVTRAIKLAHDPERNGWVERAFNFAAMHRGATDRMADRIADTINAARAP